MNVHIHKGRNSHLARVGLNDRTLTSLQQVGGRSWIHPQLAGEIAFIVSVSIQVFPSSKYTIHTVDTLSFPLLSRLRSSVIRSHPHINILARGDGRVLLRRWVSGVVAPRDAVDRRVRVCTDELPHTRQPPQQHTRKNNRESKEGWGG